MAGSRKPRPLPDTADASEAKEPWGSHRERYRLYLEIDRRLAALAEERGLTQQKAPGLATEGSACSADETED